MEKMIVLPFMDSLKYTVVDNIELKFDIYYITNLILNAI